ncbi:sulfite oxidase, partial [Lecanoromycetidae sp. Uapishka_2]
MKTKLHSAVRIAARPRPSWSQGYPRPYAAPSTCCHLSSTTSGLKHDSSFWPKIYGASIFAASAVAGSIIYDPVLHADAPPPKQNFKTSAIRLSEVHKHGRDSETKWVTKGSRVYDITDWIPGHPGGDVILRAVGGAIDQYWNIFTIHKKQEVYDILESYYIGDVDPRDLVDGKVPVDHIEDPFANDPKRDGRLIMLSERPCNAETPTEALGSFVTPNEMFYVRHHMWVPEVGEAGHKLTIELADGEEKEYSIEDLKSKFEEVHITATLQCSGNRRKHMTAGARSTNGLQWNVGAISNADWKGVRLRDVLADAGFNVNDAPDDIKHAQFIGAEAYGASIPIEKAVDKFGDVILAYEMNGLPLPPDHGYPIRVLVPGTVAARSVKWVNRILISEEESPSQWQQRDYKCFGPNVGGNPDWTSAPAIQEMPVQSAITSLRDISWLDEKNRKFLQVYGLEEDSVAVEGYAFSGGGRRIVRVDVSADDGRSWHQAELLPNDAAGKKAWAWQQWRWVLPKSQAGPCFVVKAVDEAYNTQPNEYESNYNFRGNLTSSWHRLSYKPGGK